MATLGFVWKCFHCFCHSPENNLVLVRDATQSPHWDSKPESIFCLFFSPYISLYAIIQTNHTPQSPGTCFIPIIERAFFFSDVLFLRARLFFVCMILFQLRRTQGKSVIKNATLLLISVVWHFHFVHNESNQSILYYIHITFLTSSNQK